MGVFGIADSPRELIRQLLHITHSKIAMNVATPLLVSNRKSQPIAANPMASVQINPPVAVSRRTDSWPGIRCEIVQAHRRGRIDFEFCGPVHLLAVYERGVRQEGSTIVEGLPKSTLQDYSRKFVFVPAGCRYQDWQEPRTLARIAFFYVDPGCLAASGASDTFNVKPAPRLFFENLTLWHTASKLTALMDSVSNNDRPYLEALAHVLAHELVRVTALRKRTDSQSTGGLAVWQRRKIVTYIEEHLAEPISLTVLGQLVRLSPNYFCRAFSQSFGIPPQRYHIGQRMERAKTMLAKHADSVTDIGLNVGYSETSAFSNAFRRVTGQTPSAYRQTIS
jgi:AraC family transcriptional regulator